MGYLLALLSSVCFGITNCLWVFPQRRQHFIQVIILRSVVTVSLFAIAAFSLEKDISVKFDDVLIAVFISLLSCLGLFFFTKSLQFTAVAIAVPVSAINSFFGVLVGVLVFNETLPILFFAIAVCIVLGLLLIESGKGKSLFPLTRGTVYNLLAAICWGVTFALFKLPVLALGPWKFALILELTVLCFSILLAFTVFKKERFEIEVIRQNSKWYAVLGVLAFVAVSSYILSLQFIEVSIVSLLGNLTPAVSIVVALLLFRQSITKWQWLGILLLLISFLCLNIMR